MTAAAGYSGTPLPRKLGIKTEDRVLLDRAPDGFELPGLPAGVTVHRRAGRGPYPVVLAFVRSRADLADRLPALMTNILRDGALWIAWPKRASKISTDMTENVVREVALPKGLVDVKVCAVDETWSGLKLVYRKEFR